MIPTELTCKKCGITKPLEAFYQDRNPRCLYGRRKSCIECDKAHKQSPEYKAAQKRYRESEKGKAVQNRKSTCEL